MSQDPTSKPVETPFRHPQSTGKLDADTDTSRPGRSCTSTPGLADQKDTDRLMNIMNDPTNSGQPRPALCPICGLTSDNGIARHTEVTTLVTYVCTRGHLFAVTWVEV